MQEVPLAASVELELVSACAALPCAHKRLDAVAA
jgi:hypothetical protein